MLFVLETADALTTQQFDSTALFPLSTYYKIKSNMSDKIANIKTLFNTDYNFVEMQIS